MASMLMGAGDTRSAPMDLPAHEVHLWYDVLDDAADTSLETAARHVLTSEEWDHCQRFASAAGRRERLAARYMARVVLSRYAPAVAPSDWRFRPNEHGRPEIEMPAHANALRFNISHADGVVACAVSAHHPVGVDVERLGRRAPIEIAESRFARAETAALRALPPSERARRFIEYWTLKEAYLKARGAGLSLSLHQFWFDLNRPGRPRIVFEPGFDDLATAWQFDRLFVGSDHLIAIATKRGPAPLVSLVVRTFDGPAGSDLPH